MAVQNDGGGSYTGRRSSGGTFKNTSPGRRSSGGSFGGTPNVKPKPAAAPRQPARSAPRSAPAPAPRAYSAPPTGSPIGGGGGGGGGFGAPAPVSDVDWLAGDSGYQAQLAALMKALQNTNSEFDRNLQTYETDYTTALGSLGWGDTDPIMEGDQLGWLENDLNTSVGRGRESVTNDFSGRGMLQSQHYARALDNLMRSLNDQKTSMDTGAQRFRDDIASKRTAYADENKAAQNSARAEALARRAMGYTSV